MAVGINKLEESEVYTLCATYETQLTGGCEMPYHMVDGGIVWVSVERVIGRDRTHSCVCVGGGGGVCVKVAVSNIACSPSSLQRWQVKVSTCVCVCVFFFFFT